MRAFTNRPELCYAHKLKVEPYSRASNSGMREVMKVNVILDYSTWEVWVAKSGEPS